DSITMTRSRKSRGFSCVTLAPFRKEHAMSHDALRELHATNRIFEEEVVGKGDFAALDRVYTTTARILPPGSDVMAGIENIRSFWMKAASDLGVTAIQLRTAEVRFVDETAIEIGRASMATTTAG